MLTFEKLLHFSEHGWVLLPGVFNGEQVAAYKAGLERLSRTRRAVEPGNDPELTVVDNMVMHDPLFLEWFRTPRILEANKQILGAQLRFQGVNAHIKRPHPDRNTRAAAAQLCDPDTLGWHRGLRPKWGNFPHDDDPRLMNCAFLNNITYLTDVAPRNGSTMILDGSHRLEGGYAALKSQCPIVEVPAQAGDVLLFTETLLHTGVPILSETVRFNMYYGFTPPWFCSWPGMEVPKAIVDSIADDELRAILGRTGYFGQSPEIVESTAIEQDI